MVVIVLPAFCVVFVIRHCVVFVGEVVLEMAVSDVPAFCVVLVVKRCVVFVREIVLEVLFARAITKVIIKKYEIVPLFK